MKQISIFFFFALCFITGSTFCQSESVRRTNFNVKKDIAIEGYDPVSYFEGKPTEGKNDIKLTYKGVTYLFTSQTNLNKFKGTPDKYEPAYGGWCAYAMGETGEKVKIDPETYTILNGKLYLFYNFWGNNTFVDWKQNEQKLKEAGDLNWRKIVQ
jgi:YHS domain-containing protein